MRPCCGLSYPTVIGILFRRGADFMAAEDAVQDTLVEAVRGGLDVEAVSISLERYATFIRLPENGPPYADESSFPRQKTRGLCSSDGANPHSPSLLPGPALSLESGTKPLRGGVVSARVLPVGLGDLP